MRPSSGGAVTFGRTASTQQPGTTSATIQPVDVSFGHPASIQMDAPTSVQELTGRACVRAVSPKKVGYCDGGS